MTDLKHMSSAETQVLRAIGQTWEKDSKRADLDGAQRKLRS
jgi:hypothetical protein